MSTGIYVLGGAQTDFARNWAREDKDLFVMFEEATQAALADARVDAAEIEVGHVGNFVAELFCRQGLLGGFFGLVDPAMADMPASRHEAACASGSIAILSAMTDIESGRYDCALVLGIEQMRNVPGSEAAEHLGAAIWTNHECQGVRWPWPHLFARLGDEYERRYGLKHEHLMAISRNNFDNARRNPYAQSRNWTFTEASFTADDEANPVIDGRIRKLDCGQVTDGAAAVVLAGERKAREWARRHDVPLESLPRIKGWGHRTAQIAFEPKLVASRDALHVFPHVRRATAEALARAGIDDVYALDGIETHDCFTTTEYMAIDHFGLTPPGENWQVIEDGTIAMGGRLPINPSGGLIGLGHPVGATGVRMVLDCARQVTDRAGDCQVEGARDFATLNVGGSACTVVSFVVGC
jgi:acetyl-CoA C-acetyltransferase